MNCLNCKKYSLLIVMVLTIGYVNSQQLNFYSEALNFEIDSTHFYVSGMYFISNKNNKQGRTKIFYPYVYNTNIIDTISIYNCNTMEYIKPFKGKKGHWFNLAIPANDSVVLHIKYSHRHNDSTVTYILLSTQYWEKPFIKADYTLRVKTGITVNKLFLPVDTTWHKPPYQYYQWQKFNYMPKTDFIVNFSINH